MIQFERPEYFLLLIPILPFLLYWQRKSYADLSATRAKLVLAARGLALLLCVLALTKPVLNLRSTDQAVLFLVDVSDSVPAEALDQTWAKIAESTQELSRGQKAGLVLFAQRAREVIPLQREPLKLTGALKRKLFHRRERDRIQEEVRRLERTKLDAEGEAKLAALGRQLKEIAAWRTQLGVEGTDLEGAFRLARGLLPQEARRRLVLFSDGNANRGDVRKELNELARGGFSVHTVPQRPAKDKAEVIAKRLVVPAEAQVKAPFDIELEVTSSKKTKATVILYRNKYKIATKEVELQQGKNVLEIPRNTLDEGFHEFEAVVKPADAGADTILENNVARAAVRVNGRPKVLLIERKVKEARYLEEALRKEEIEVEVRPERGIPDSMNDLLNYQVLILSNVTASSMTLAQMGMIKRYVREMGGGLIMLGGDHSFGLGGYYRTPIEDALPIRMPIRKNVQKPNLALVLVIDKSGSMGGEKIQLAKEAAIASAEVLKPSDQFGVVAFDSLAQWICPLTEASDNDSITATVAKLVAGGGTNIYPALYDAYKALLDSEAKLKHIILLSDGQTTGSGYEELVSHIAADEITLSTVGIGDDADKKLLENLAQWGGGEAYFTNDFSQIPQIFTRETLRASKSMLIEEPFVPKMVASTPALKGIDLESMPFLLGYVATQKRETATVSLVSDYGDPILATWNYGLGRAAAFTSDAKARWAGDWIGWEYFGKFWAQLIRQVMSTGAHHDLRTRSRVSIKNGKVELTMDVRGRRGEFRDDVQPEVRLGAKGQAAKPLAVRHVAPGVFKSTFPLEKYGEFYRLALIQRRKGKVVGFKSLAVTESYSPEFGSTTVDEDALKLIAGQTGGRYQPGAGDVWSFEGDPARTPQETWWYWLLAAACLLPLDLGLRRTG